MSLRIALALAALSATGCVSSTFIDDVEFLKRHTEVIILTTDRTSFMPGVLLAIRKVADLEDSPLVGLEHLL